MLKAIKKWAVGTAGDYAKKYLTVENITQWIIEWVNTLLQKAMKNIDAEKLAKVCETTNKVSVLCGTLSKALADKTITEAEAEQILQDIRNIIGAADVTDEKIAALVDKAVGEIQAKM